MRQRSVRRTVAAVSALLIATTASACGGDSSSASLEEEGSLRIGIAGANALTWAPYHVAVGQGMLKEELGKVDADYEVVEFAGGSPLFAAMSAGDVDVAFVPTSTVAALNMKGRGLQCIMSLSKGGSHVLVGASRYESERGTDLAEYDGGTWGYSSEGSTAPKTNQILLEGLGLSWADQKGLALGSTTANGPALRSDRVDIITVDPAVAASVLADGDGYVVLNTNDPESSFPFPETGTCMAVSEDLAESNPEILTAAAAAMLRAIRMIQENSDDPSAVIDLLEERPGGGSWDEAEWTLVQQAFEGLDGIPTEETRAQTRDLTEAQFGTAPTEEVMAASFREDIILAAYDELGIEPDGAR